MDSRYAYGVSGIWGYPNPPNAAQIPPGGTDLLTYANYACSTSVPIIISVTIPAAKKPPTPVLTVPALGAQQSGTLTFKMPNIGQHLTHGIFVPGVTFLESWGRWPSSSCTLNGRSWGASPGLEDLSISSVPPGPRHCGVGLGSGLRPGAVSSEGSQSAPCPLTLTITMSQVSQSFAATRGGTTGLGFQQAQTGPGGTPEFLYPDLNTEEAERCIAGCTNVVVTVTNTRTHEPVQHAQVSASVTPFSPRGVAPYPEGYHADLGHLCRADEPERCGSFLSYSELPPTDIYGQVHFTYWSPGAVRPQTVKITVKAQRVCSPNAYCAGHYVGQVTQNDTVNPHIIYSSTGTLNRDQLDVLIEWAKNNGNFETIGGQLKDAAAEHVLSYALGQAVEFYAEKAVPVLGAAELLHAVITKRSDYAELSTATGQEEALTALLATPLGLVTAGLGTVNAGDLDPAFLDMIAGKDGLLRQYGLKLAYLEEHQTGFASQEMQLTLEEVSYCKQGQVCGPGDSTPGVEPFLYLYFQAGTPPGDVAKFGGKFPEFVDALVLPYDPVYFDLLQFNGNAPPAS